MNIAVLIGAMIAIIVAVNLLPAITKQIEQVTENTTTTQQVIQQTIPLQTFSEPSWILWILSGTLIVLLIAWYIGKKKKISWLGDKDE